MPLSTALLSIVTNNVNKQNVSTMNYIMIKTYCHKITDNLIFYSFNKKNKYEDTSIESFNGSINWSRILDSYFQIDLYENKLDTYQIIWLNHNVLEVSQYLCECKYEYKPCVDTTYEEEKNRKMNDIVNGLTKKLFLI